MKLFKKSFLFCAILSSSYFFAAGKTVESNKSSLPYSNDVESFERFKDVKVVIYKDNKYFRSILKGWFEKDKLPENHYSSGYMNRIFEIEWNDLPFYSDESSK